MRHIRGTTRLMLAVFVLLVPSAAHAGPAYAIRGARIVPVKGPVIEKGNIVMRDGVIVAVGADATIPADAIVIDGAGLHVYPGLVDAYTNFGVPRPRPQGQQQQAALPAGLPPQLAQFLGPQAQAGGQRGVWEPDQTNDPSNYLSPPPRGVTPEMVVARELEPGNEALAMRGVGVTSVLSAPLAGILRGQSAVVSLGDGEPGSLVIRTPFAMHAALTAGGGGGGGYPGSQMGAIAAFRQTLLDAQWYAARKAQWEQRNGQGVPRPPYSASSEALQDVIAGRQTVVFSVTQWNDVLKVLRLAEEFKLRVIVETNANAVRVAPQLKQAGVPVILSLNFRVPTGGGGGFGGFGQQQPDEDEQREREQEAQRAAAELAKAGVNVVFSSVGLGSYPEFVTNARTAAEHLGKDVALEALTIRAAELFGLSNSLGSLEAGKIANVIVTTGHPLDQGSQLRHVFVDGQPVRFRAPDPPRPAPGQQQQQQRRRPGGQRPPGEDGGSQKEVRP
ncbi:MAG TPA: amidohydrolase family protein [Candidatus Acidoferrales bacterium]